MTRRGKGASVLPPPFGTCHREASSFCSRSRLGVSDNRVHEVSEGTMALRKILFVLCIAAISASDQVGDDSHTTVSRKERFLLATLKFRNHLCNTDGETGVCKSWKECWLGRGRSVGSCPLGHGVCCLYEYTCGNMTSERVSYFVSPNVFTPHCSLRVNVYDRRVTQLRLDFKRFSLSQPTRGNLLSNQAYFCRNDSFTVISSSAGASNNFGFDKLCGENSGQHIYVPVNATLGPAYVELIFNLVDRGNNNLVGATPDWRIKITQIDCGAPDTRELCAPDGCLQYYPSRTGTFESFNFNNGAGHYQGLLNYAICFKRFNGICSIQYNAEAFQLATDNLAAPYGESGCNVATISNDLINSQDYLFIPAANLANGINASLFCGDALVNDSARTNAPGPMFVFFRTDATADPITLGDEIGFKIRYQESSSDCYGTAYSQGLLG